MLLSGTVFSKTMEMDTGVTVIAPNDTLPQGGYKIAYVLHGLNGNHASWANYSMLPAYAAHGKTVYVLPDGGRSFYADMRFGLNYLTYVTEELPAICQSLFRISAARENTLVLGNSMGGYGAVKCALTRPELYGACAAFATPCLFLSEAAAALQHPEAQAAFAAQFGEHLLNDFRCWLGPDLACGPESDVSALLEKAAAAPDRPAFYLTCGTEDAFLAENRRFAEILRGKPFECEFEVWEGGHNFEFFNQSIKRAIDRFGL